MPGVAMVQHSQPGLARTELPSGGEEGRKGVRPQGERGEQAIGGQHWVSGCPKGTTWLSGMDAGDGAGCWAHG